MAGAEQAHRQSFLSRVRAALPGLHPSERRLADLVLDFPGELASYSATELARLANVSNASVTRFVRRLGYGSFEEARQHARADGQSGAALFLVRAGDAAGDPVGIHLEQGQANLAQTFLSLGAAEIDAMAERLLSARRVLVIGFRTSRAFAQYFYWQTLQVIETMSVVPGPGETLGEHLAGLGREDCVVVFALRRRPKQASAVVEALVRSGAAILYVTDEGVAHDPRMKLHVRCRTAAPGPLFSHVAVMGVCHLLATRVIERAGATGRRRLAAIESLHEDLDEI